MTKNTIVLTALLIILLVGGTIWYLQTHQNSVNLPEQNRESAEQNNALVPGAETSSSKQPLQTPISAVSSIKVLTPETNQNVDSGRTYVIKWEPGNAPVAVNQVSIQLQNKAAMNKTGCPGYSGTPLPKYSCVTYTIAQDILNNGSFTWTVGKTVTSDLVDSSYSYYVRIYYSDVGMEESHQLTQKGYKLETYSNSTLGIVAAGGI
jgi:hypothetical protein